MINSYGRIYRTDEDQLNLLDLPVSKFSSNTLNAPKFAAIAMLVNTTGSDGLIEAQPIGPAPANRFAQGVARFKRQIENALKSLQLDAALNKRHPIAAFASRASTCSPDSGQGKGKKNSKSGGKGTKNSKFGMRHCSAHGACNQTNDECHAQTKTQDKLATRKVSKKKTQKTPVGSSKCSLCGKKHEKSNCPILKEIFQAECKRQSTAKITEIGDGDAIRKTASAKKASNSTIKLGRNDITAIVRKHIQANRARTSARIEVIQSVVNNQAAQKMRQESAKSVRVRIPSSTKGLIHFGASPWMTPDRNVFETLQLLPKNAGHVVYLADNRTVLIHCVGDIVYDFDGHKRRIWNALYIPDLVEPLCSLFNMIEGTQDTVAFSDQGVYLYVRQENRSIPIGRRVGDLYYLLSTVNLA
ncbi:hypothetical protein HDU96_010873, partial [Phlyctochytrium bullatum]